MDTLWQDLKFAFRQLRKSPGFAAAAVLTLALGIGATTAIFSVVNGVLLGRLPYHDSERLVRFGAVFSVPEFESFREQAKSFAAIEEYHDMQFPLTGGPEPEMVRVGIVSAGFFDSLGIEPVAGRTFVPEESHLDAPASVVLTRRYWRDRFGGDPAVVGRILELNGEPATVVGVVPDLLAYPRAQDIYANPVSCSFRTLVGKTQNANFRLLYLIGRLKAGATREQAKAELATIGDRLREQYPDAYGAEADMPPPPDFPLTPILEDITGEARPKLLILFGTVFLVLLIACFNVGNLTLARLSQRDREVTLRSALGASRKRVVRALLTESTLVALIGGALGLAFAYSGLSLLRAYTSRFTVRTDDIRIDGAVLLFALALSLASGLAFGLVPVLAGFRRDMSVALKEGSGQSTAGSGRQRLRGLLLVFQMAVSFVLLVGAGLTSRSLLKLYQFEPGFRVASLLSFNVTLPESRFKTRPEIQTFYDALIEKVAANPSVAGAGLGVDFPLFDDQSGTPVEIEGRPVEPGSEPKAAFDLVSERYFETLGIPLLRGRAFAPSDDLAAPRVVIINQFFAEEQWPGVDPVGQRINLKYFGSRGYASIVGVVADAKNIQRIGGEGETRAAFYLPFRQQPSRGIKVFVRTAGRPEAALRDVVAAVRSLDSSLPIGNLQTLEQARGKVLAPNRVITLLLALFAAVAFAITAVGMTGVTASSVAERTQEIGVRTALGAGRRTVLRLMLRRSMGLALAGLAVGLAGALALTRFLSSVIYGVAPTDVLTYVVVSLVLVAVVWVAAWLPARRASRVDPVVALRLE